MDHYEINSVNDLMVAAQDLKTGGYEAEVTVQPNRHKHIPSAPTSGYWLVIEATTNYPHVVGFEGEYWFYADGTVMQVL
jgi:hypothetical protein